jgi:hypothetical protein
VKARPTGFVLTPEFEATLRTAERGATEALDRAGLDGAAAPRDARAAAAADLAAAARDYAGGAGEAGGGPLSREDLEATNELIQQLVGAIAEQQSREQQSRKGLSRASTSQI